MAVEVTPMTGAGGWLQVVRDVRREGAHSGPEKRLDQIRHLASPPFVRDVLLVPDYRASLSMLGSARHGLALQVRSWYLDPALGGMKNRETIRVRAFAVRLG